MAFKVLAATARPRKRALVFCIIVFCSVLFVAVEAHAERRFATKGKSRATTVRRVTQPITRPTLDIPYNRQPGRRLKQTATAQQDSQRLPTRQLPGLRIHGPTKITLNFNVGQAGATGSSGATIVQSSTQN